MAPAEDRETRRRTPQNRPAHYLMIALSTALALGVGAWLMMTGGR